MKIFKTLVACALAVSSLSAAAQTATYACQFVESSGMVWEKQRWKTTSFKLDRPFFLKSINSKLELESVAKALGRARVNSVLCHEPFEGAQVCSDFLGGSLMFDFGTMNGGIAKLLGTSLPTNDKEKDTVHIDAYTCSKM
jgi:hypothetical protein